jgi:hypothetical protein
LGDRNEASSDDDAASDYAEAMLILEVLEDQFDKRVQR